MGGAAAAVLVLSVVAWVPAASAAPVSANVSIIATGTGVEDHFTQNVLDPGDELSPNDGFVRTLDATRVGLSYTPDTGSGGSTNLVLTATISTTHAGWDLRGTNFATGANPPCPGGISTPQRHILVCNVGTIATNTPVTFNPVMRISAAAGNNFAFHVDVTVSDTNNTATSSTPDIFTSAAPRFDLEKNIGSPTQTPTSFGLEGNYMLKIGDADPLGISALTNPVTFVDHVDQDARVTRCNDTTPVTLLAPPLTNPDAQYMQVVGSCNGAPFSATPNTGLTNGQSVNVSMANVDWDRIYPPPTVANGISDATNGWVIASMQYYMETDKTDVELGDNIPNNNVGQLEVGNVIGMSGYNSTTDAGIGPSVWNPVDIQGNPNLGSDDSPGEDDTSDNAATYTHNLFLDARHGKYVSELVVDGQQVTTRLTAVDAGTVSWPNEIDLCDKFDNRRANVVQAPGSSEAVVNITAPNDPVFTAATVEYGRSAGWGPGAGPTGTQWWNMTQSGCDPADVVGSTFYTSNQVDWTNSNLASINARDINMVRYLPAGPFLNPQNQRATYSVNVHFQVADNDAGDYIVDYSSYDPDGAGGATPWETSSCNGGTIGNCPDPPELAQNNAYYRPGPANSGVMIHIDSHPTIRKDVVNPQSASGTTPIDFTYEIDLGNTRIPGDTTPRQTFTVRDVLPPQIKFVPGSQQLYSNTAGLNVSGPVVTTQGNSDVLTWTIDGLTLDVDSADMPVLRYDGRADQYTPSSGAAGYINRASITGPGILDPNTTPWSPNSTITPQQFLNLSQAGPGNLPQSRWGVFDEARVTVNGAGRAITEKRVSAPTSEPGDTFRYTLVYGNAGDDVERMDAYDILPFDGDARGTTTHGSLELLSVTEDVGSDVEVWISDTPGATLDALDNTQPVGVGSPVVGGINPTWPTLPGLGSSTWPCQIQFAGQGPCPPLSTVTAIRIVGPDPNPGATGGADSFMPSGSGPYGIDVEVRSVGGRGADEFHNNWATLFPPLGTPTSAAAPAHTLLEGAIGDRVFHDVNENGIFDSGDAGIPNVEVRVFRQGNVVATTQTDADGRWIVENLTPGDYRVRIPSTEFDGGAPLDGFVAGPSAAADPDVDQDEGTDHDAHAVSNGVEAGGDVTLAYGTEPLLDDAGSLSFLRDGDTNLTVDFGLVQQTTTTTTTTTPTTTTTTGSTPAPGPPSGPNPPSGSLPRTGWESLIWILLGGSLVLGGAMVISRRQDLRA
jgi:hypothetical protein